MLFSSFSRIRSSLLCEWLILFHCYVWVEVFELRQLVFGFAYYMVALLSRWKNQWDILVVISFDIACWLVYLAHTFWKTLLALHDKTRLFAYWFLCSFTAFIRSWHRVPQKRNMCSKSSFWSSSETQINWTRKAKRFHKTKRLVEVASLTVYSSKWVKEIVWGFEDNSQG